MRWFVPFGEEAVEKKGGFSDTAGAMEEEGLWDAEVVGEVVEDCFKDGTRDDTPWI